MHILFLTDNFPPEVNAPASRTFEHCREWVKNGHEITVITCAPNFPKGRVYDGYKNKFWQTELVDGIKIIRVWTYITANEGFVKRILDYLSFMFAAIPASFFVKKPTMVIGTSPQFFTACAACVVGWLKNIPFIFELRDIWPESVKAVGAMDDSFVLRFFERIEMFLYRRATKIISVTHSFKKSLIEKGVKGNKIDVVTNGVDSSRFKVQKKDRELVKKFGLDGKFVAGYIGTHGMAHSLETLLEAAEEIQKRPDSKDYFFLFLGHGARKKELMTMAHSKGLENVTFINSVPKEEVVRYWSLLDLSIIHLKKTPLFTSVIPSKLFECMAMGIPVLHGVAGESAAIVQKEHVGIVFEPENHIELVDKVILLRNDRIQYETLQTNCLTAAKSYDRKYLADAMLNILKSIA